MITAKLSPSTFRTFNVSDFLTECHLKHKQGDRYERYFIMDWWRSIIGTPVNCLRNIPTQTLKNAVAYMIQDADYANRSQSIPNHISDRSAKAVGEVIGLLEKYQPSSEADTRVEEFLRTAGNPATGLLYPDKVCEAIALCEASQMYKFEVVKDSGCVIPRDMDLYFSNPTAPLKRGQKRTRRTKQA